MNAARVRLLILCALIAAEAKRRADAEERRRVEWAENDSDLARWQVARAEGLL